MVFWFELGSASLSIRKTGVGGEKKMAMGGTKYYPLKKRK